MEYSPRSWRWAPSKTPPREVTRPVRPTESLSRTFALVAALGVVLLLCVGFTDVIFTSTKSFDGFKNVVYVGDGKWVLSDDGLGEVFAMNLSSSHARGDLQPLRSLPAPNGLAVSHSDGFVFLSGVDKTEGPYLTRLTRLSSGSRLEEGSEWATVVYLRRFDHRITAPKKALLHPSGAFLVLADQAAACLWLVTRLDQYPDVGLSLLTSTTGHLSTPHGMAWIDCASDGIWVPTDLSETDNDMKQLYPTHHMLTPTSNRTFSTSGLVFLDSQLLYFLPMWDVSTTASGPIAEIEPIEVLNLAETVGSENFDGMDLQFLNDGKALMVLSKGRTCGLFRLTLPLLRGSPSLAHLTTDKPSARRLSPCLGDLPPHGMGCTPNGEGCVVVAPAQEGGGAALWLDSTDTSKQPMASLLRINLKLSTSDSGIFEEGIQPKNFPGSLSILQSAHSARGEDRTFGEMWWWWPVLATSGTVAVLVVACRVHLASCCLPASACPAMKPQGPVRSVQIELTDTSSHVPFYGATTTATTTTATSTSTISIT